ncbi:DUF2281 domain-containing protein [Candidatus Thiosymbion oneisti]|uniref:DUF2281 domain-containing protein n=1 Tax=Candidatus Thiosymbion oneisti TaxID=589554 RepID=UPI00105B37FB|nr:DUF2281 domain-containing protein [Candidatus Thiosymbion oneisti]
MLLTEVIYEHSRRLPEQAAREALSYIEFLEDRYGVMQPADTDTKDTERFLAAVTGGLSEDFPDDITDKDLGVDVPRRNLD